MKQLFTANVEIMLCPLGICSGHGRANSTTQEEESLQKLPQSPFVVLNSPSTQLCTVQCATQSIVRHPQIFPRPAQFLLELQTRIFHNHGKGLPTGDFSWLKVSRCGRDTDAKIKVLTGESPRRVLLRDCEIFGNLRLKL